MSLINARIEKLINKREREAHENFKNSPRQKSEIRNWIEIVPKKSKKWINFIENLEATLLCKQLINQASVYAN